MTNTKWIDFGKLRKELSFEEVMDHYNIDTEKVKSKGGGNQYKTICPLPGHKSKNGDKTFSFNGERKVFQCFSCKEKGSVLDFIVLMEGGDPLDGQSFRTSITKAMNWISPDTGYESELFPAEEMQSMVSEPEEEEDLENDLPEMINAPLDFELKSLDQSHDFFKTNEITNETVSHFGAGFCNRGYFKGRIAIPINDQTGNLIGYTGLSPSEDVSPRYLLPKDRTHEGVIYRFDPGQILYNGHIFHGQEKTDEVIVAPDIIDVWRLFQLGHTHSVSFLDNNVTETNLEILCGITTDHGKILVVHHDTDSDKKRAKTLCGQIAAFRYVALFRYESILELIQNDS